MSDDGATNLHAQSQTLACLDMQTMTRNKPISWPFVIMKTQEFPLLKKTKSPGIENNMIIVYVQWHYLQIHDTMRKLTSWAPSWTQNDAS